MSISIEDYDKRLREQRLADSQQLKRKIEHDKLTGEDIYVVFKLWCLAFNLAVTMADNFRAYLEIEHITLTEYQTEYISNKYFGGQL